jgi:hypothetical protein
LLQRINADDLAAATLVFEFDNTFDECKERVVFSASDILAGLPLGATLTR